MIFFFSCTKTEIIEVGNATVPIVRGVDSEEGGGAGVTAAPLDDIQDKGQHRSLVTVTFEELSFQVNFWGTETSVTGGDVELAVHESASTQGEDGDRGSTRGERLQPA